MSSDKIDIEVKYLMSSPVVTILKNETLDEVAKVMSKNILEASLLSILKENH